MNTCYFVPMLYQALGPSIRDLQVMSLLLCRDKHKGTALLYDTQVNVLTSLCSSRDSVEEDGWGGECTML